MVTLGLSAGGEPTLSAGRDEAQGARGYAEGVHLALIKYSVMRLAIFVVSLVVLWAVGVRQSLLMLVLAALVSLALSYLLLRKPREELAQALADRTRDRLERHATVGQSDADEEDAIIDAVQRQDRAAQSAAPENSSES
jgi:biopolymer transport protein ExbB/TolQ